MNRLILFILTLALTSGAGLRAEGRGGASASDRQLHPALHHQQQQQEGPQSRTHDGQQLCVKTRAEARHLERYTERSSFEPVTARQLGRQLRERLEAMEREHRRLRERLAGVEQEQQRARLQKMDEYQQGWQEAFAGIEEELEQNSPSRTVLRRQARAIDKAIKNYQKEIQRLEEALGD